LDNNNKVRAVFNDRSDCIIIKKLGLYFVLVSVTGKSKLKLFALVFEIFLMGYRLTIFASCLLEVTLKNVNTIEYESYSNLHSHRDTVVPIVSCRCTYCYLETSYGKITINYSRYCTVEYCYVHKCELSYMCPGQDIKLHPHQVK